MAVVLFSCAPSFSFRGLFIFPIREIFFSNWASDFARFLNHDAKIRNPDLSGVRYHAIPCDSGTFSEKPSTLNIKKASVPSDSIAGPSPAKLTLITNNSPLSRFPEVFYDSLYLFGSKRLASLVIFHLLQLIPERPATPNPTHEMIHGRAWHTLRKVHQAQFLLRIRAVYKIFHNLNF